MSLGLFGTNRMVGAAQGVLDVAENGIHPSKLGALDRGLSAAHQRASAQAIFPLRLSSYRPRASAGRPSQELVMLLGLIGLLILAVGTSRGIREYLRRIAEALYDEWQRPR